MLFWLSFSSQCLRFIPHDVVYQGFVPIAMGGSHRAIYSVLKAIGELALLCYPPLAHETVKLLSASRSYFIFTLDRLLTKTRVSARRFAKADMMTFNNLRCFRVRCFAAFSLGVVISPRNAGNLEYHVTLMTNLSRRVKSRARSDATR